MMHRPEGSVLPGTPVKTDAARAHGPDFDRPTNNDALGKGSRRDADYWHLPASGSETADFRAAAILPESEGQLTCGGRGREDRS
jgi:hypothetical protein